MKNKKPVEPRYPKPYAAEVVYLDIPSSRVSTSLEKDLKLLGATIEKCLSKEVTLVVSDTVEGCASRTNQPSPSPSPMTPSPYMTGMRGSINSPQADSPGASANISQFSRAAKIVNKANVTKNRGTSNIIKIAERLNIPVTSSQKLREKLQKDLAKIPNEVRFAADTKGKFEKRKDMNIPREHRVRKLTGNVIKFEDLSRHYRPTYDKGIEWPVLHTDTPSKGSPFVEDKGRSQQCGTDEERAERPDERGADNNNVPNCTTKDDQTETTQKDSKKKNSSKKSKTESNKANTTKQQIEPFDFETGPRLFTAGELRRIMVEKRRAERNRGYCEMCQVKYDEIHQHLSSDQHRKFAKNEDNFVDLDTMISSGPNMDQFLNDVVKYHKLHMKQGLEEKEMEDEVLLIKEGISSPLVKPKKTPVRAKLGADDKNKPHSSKKQLRFAEGEKKDIQQQDREVKKEANPKFMKSPPRNVRVVKQQNNSATADERRKSVKRKSEGDAFAQVDIDTPSPAKRTRLSLGNIPQKTGSPKRPSTRASENVQKIESGAKTPETPKLRKPTETQQGKDSITHTPETRRNRVHSPKTPKLQQEQSAEKRQTRSKIKDSGVETPKTPKTLVQTVTTNTETPKTRVQSPSTREKRAPDTVSHKQTPETFKTRSERKSEVPTMETSTPTARKQPETLNVESPKTRAQKREMDTSEPRKTRSQDIHAKCTSPKQTRTSAPSSSTPSDAFMAPRAEIEISKELFGTPKDKSGNCDSPRRLLRSANRSENSPNKCVSDSRREKYENSPINRRVQQKPRKSLCNVENLQAKSKNIESVAEKAVSQTHLVKNKENESSCFEPEENFEKQDDVMMSDINMKRMNKMYAAVKGLDWSNIVFSSGRTRERTRNDSQDTSRSNSQDTVGSDSREKARKVKCNTQPVCDSVRTPVVEDENVLNSSFEIQLLAESDDKSKRVRHKDGSTKVSSPAREKTRNASQSKDRGAKSSDDKHASGADERNPQNKKDASNEDNPDTRAGTKTEKKDSTPRRGKIRGGARNSIESVPNTTCSEDAGVNDSDKDSDTDGALPSAICGTSLEVKRSHVSNGDETCHANVNQSGQNSNLQRLAILQSNSQSSNKDSRPSLVSLENIRCSVASSPIRIRSGSGSIGNVRQVRVQMCRDIVEKRLDLFDLAESTSSKKSYICSEEIEQHLAKTKYREEVKQLNVSSSLSNTDNSKEKAPELSENKLILTNQKMSMQQTDNKENKSPSKQLRDKTDEMTSEKQCSRRILKDISSVDNTDVSRRDEQPKRRKIKRKVKKKLNSSIQVLSDRSMISFLQSEGDYDGFDSRLQANTDLDISYREIDELELTDHSDIELVVNDDTHGPWRQPDTLANESNNKSVTPADGEETEKRIVAECKGNPGRVLDWAFRKWGTDEYKNEFYVSSPKRPKYGQLRRSPRKGNLSFGQSRQQNTSVFVEASSGELENLSKNNSSLLECGLFVSTSFSGRADSFSHKSNQDVPANSLPFINNLYYSNLDSLNTSKQQVDISTQQDVSNMAVQGSRINMSQSLNFMKSFDQAEASGKLNNDKLITIDSVEFSPEIPHLAKDIIEPSSALRSSLNDHILNYFAEQSEGSTGDEKELADLCKEEFDGLMHSTPVRSHSNKLKKSMKFNDSPRMLSLRRTPRLNSSAERIKVTNVESTSVQKRNKTIDTTITVDANKENVENSSILDDESSAVTPVDSEIEFNFKSPEKKRESMLASLASDLKEKSENPQVSILKSSKRKLNLPENTSLRTSKRQKLSKKSSPTVNKALKIKGKPAYNFFNSKLRHKRKLSKSHLVKNKLSKARLPVVTRYLRSRVSQYDFDDSSPEFTPFSNFSMSKRSEARLNSKNNTQCTKPPSFSDNKKCELSNRKRLSILTAKIQKNSGKCLCTEHESGSTCCGDKLESKMPDIRLEPVRSSPRNLPRLSTYTNGAENIPVLSCVEDSTRRRSKRISSATDNVSNEREHKDFGGYLSLAYLSSLNNG